MKHESDGTIGALLFRSYANLAMAEMAVNNGDATYSQKHYMIRSRLLAGLKRGTMAPKSLMRDQRIRMALPQECIYCGQTENLTIDHVVATNRGGADVGDNAVWACRRCNSSKGDKDLFGWWFQTRDDFPPLFVIRIYLKQAIAYCVSHDLMNRQVTDVDQEPFAFRSIPTSFPEPRLLRFSPYHARRKEADS